MPCIRRTTPRFIVSLPLLLLVVCTTAVAHGTELLPAGDPGRQGVTTMAHSWERWEATFVAEGSYANPYSDVDLKLQLTGPLGQTTTIYGFWDGDSTWRVRYAFPMIGEWTYVTSCSNQNDAGLHQRRGSVTVEKYLDGNELYKHGFLRADGGDGRYFQHWDGLPFLYLGDTTWFPWAHWSYSGWEEFVEDRAAKGFTVIQVSLGFAEWWDKWSDGGCSGTPTIGVPPWFGQIGGADKYNPSFYQVVDRFVQIANQHGIVVSVFGLMNVGQDGVVSSSDRRRFARTIAARLQGNATTLSPPVDDDWDLQQIMQDVGEHLDETNDTIRPPLMTAHMGTSAYNCGNAQQPGNYSCDLMDESWVSFMSYQSGHNKPLGDEMILWAVRRAREMPLEYSSRNRRLPVVNAEPLYEMPSDWFPADSDLDDNAYRCRQIGWYTFLSGGMGHAYGIWGIWDFGLYQRAPCGTPVIDWRDAVDNQFSRDAENTARFLNGVNWHLLRPRHDLIRDQVSDERKKKVLAMATDTSFMVAYLPRGIGGIQIDTREMRGGGVYRWYNPRTGAMGVGSLWTNDNENTRFTSPDSSQDWVLLMEINTLPPPPTTGADDLEVISSSGAPAVALHPASPNPFSASTSIDFELVGSEQVQLAVFDVAGRLVTTLIDRDLHGPARYRLQWNGTDSRGADTGTGIYFFRLRAGDQRQTKKVLRIR